MRSTLSRDRLLVKAQIIAVQGTWEIISRCWMIVTDSSHAYCCFHSIPFSCTRFISVVFCVARWINWDVSGVFWNWDVFEISFQYSSVFPSLRPHALNLRLPTVNELLDNNSNSSSHCINCILPIFRLKFKFILHILQNYYYLCRFLLTINEAKCMNRWWSPSCTWTLSVWALRITLTSFVNTCTCKNYWK